MALDPAIVTVALGLGSGVAGAIVTVIAAKITSVPAREVALTGRFTALVEQQRAELDRSLAHTSRLEAALVHAREALDRWEEWADSVSLLVQQLGGKPPEKPHLNGYGAQP